MSGRGHIVLMADDDEDDQLLAKSAFRRSGVPMDVRFVKDGVELMDYLRHAGDFTAPESAPRPALVLIDLNMPRKDGREVLAEIRADPELQLLPVIVFTTSHSDHDVRLAYQLGANAYVTKPVSFVELAEMVGALGHYWLELVRLPSVA